MDTFTPIESPPAAPAADPLPFRRPSDYYSPAEPALRPIFPRWVPIGCGWAALAFVILLFLAGALVPRSGSLVGVIFGKVGDDLAAHFSKDVTPLQKADFNAEMKILRAAAVNGKLKFDKTQTFLRTATAVDDDEKIDHAEADKLIAALREVNRSVK